MELLPAVLLIRDADSSTIHEKNLLTDLIKTILFFAIRNDADRCWAIHIIQKCPVARPTALHPEY